MYLFFSQYWKDTIPLSYCSWEVRHQISCWHSYAVSHWVVHFTERDMWVAGLRGKEQGDIKSQAAPEPLVAHITLTLYSGVQQISPGLQRIFTPPKSWVLACSPKNSFYFRNNLIVLKIYKIIYPAISVVTYQEEFSHLTLSTMWLKYRLLLSSQIVFPWKGLVGTLNFKFKIGFKKW